MSGIFTDSTSISPISAINSLRSSFAPLASDSHFSLSNSVNCVIPFRLKKIELRVVLLRLLALLHLWPLNSALVENLRNDLDRPLGRFRLCVNPLGDLQN